MGAIECGYEAPEGAYLKIAALLLERGADVHARDKGNRTVLHHPVGQRTFLKPDEYGEMVELMIAHSADVNARVVTSYQKGWTPLMTATEVRSKRAVEALLKAGADPTLGFSERENGKRIIVTPLTLAEKYGEGDVIQLLNTYLKTPK